MWRWPDSDEDGRVTVGWLRLSRWGRRWGSPVAWAVLAIGMFGLGFRFGQEFSPVDVSPVSEAAPAAWLPLFDSPVAEAGSLRPPAQQGQPEEGKAAAGGRAEDRNAEGPKTPCAGTPGSPTALTVNVNQASAEQLEALPGIGPVLARRIVEWRERLGPFQQLEDLAEVPGIGPRVLERLKDRVVVAGP